MEDFSEEEKRTIVEKNTVKRIRPKHLCKKYHTFQYVIESSHCRLVAKIWLMHRKFIHIGSRGSLLHHDLSM